MAKENKTKVLSQHLDDRRKSLNEIKKGNALSNTLFERAMEAEKEKILTEYTTIYEKALDKISSLETERKKLSTGEKKFKKDEKGEFIEEQTFTEQAVQRNRKISEQLDKLYPAIDEAMFEGSYEKWQALNKLIK